MPDQHPHQHQHHIAHHPVLNQPGLLRRVLCMVLLGLMSWAVQAESVADYAGTWSFEFSGSDTGAGTAVINSQGQLRGQGGAAMLPNEPLIVSGQIEADGKTSFSVSPNGMSNTGAVFAGKLDSSGKGAGTWRNPQYGMQGTWHATRTSASQQPPANASWMRCQVKGFAPFESSTARADYLVNRNTQKGDFRILINNGLKDESWVSLDLKGYRVFAAGTAPLDSWPLWVSNADLGRSRHMHLKGSWKFTVFDPASKRVAGTASFTGEGMVDGACQFDLFLYVADFSNMPRP